MPQKDEAAPKPQRGRPRDPERVRRILEAARSHFYAHGLERASLDAIAADAGVSKMTVYSHFKSKEGLFEAVVLERTERVMGGGAGSTDAAGALKVPHPSGRLTYPCRCSWAMGTSVPSARDNRALLREAVRVFMAAYERA